MQAAPDCATSMPAAAVNFFSDNHGASAVCSMQVPANSTASCRRRCPPPSATAAAGRLLTGMCSLRFQSACKTGRR